MATLTRDQAIKWDKMLSGGYHFDVRHYVLWNEKTASLKVELSEDKILEASLSYREERQGFRATGRQKPVLHLALWNVNRETGVGTSSGLGVFLDVGEVQDKKNWKYLCQLSGEYTADKIMELATEHAGQLGNPYLFTKTA
jgi:hypothetical protein